MSYGKHGGSKHGAYRPVSRQPPGMTQKTYTVLGLLYVFNPGQPQLDSIRRAKKFFRSPTFGTAFVFPHV
ncbi:Vascular non-inflammatory molecule 2 [Manis javanica]|nr:Vascular non-inflammatory molecule 2 [Manis javanica]